MPHPTLASSPAPATAAPTAPTASTRRHWLLGGLALPLAHGLWALAPATSQAHTPGDVLPGRRRPDVATLELLDRDSGRISPVHRHQGQRYVAGQPGARYALRVRNLSPRRLLAVLSVDGVNVVSGETAAWHQTGYVLEPGASVDVTGWRKSDQEVAAFEFAALADSYAARTGRAGHVGVIGLAAFVERWHPPSPAPSVAEAPRAEAPSAAGTAAPAAERSARADLGKLGTGHGAREWSAVARTHFERASGTPDQVLQLAYDSPQRLVAAGIIVPPPRPLPGLPSPFPANAGYVPDPPLRW